MFPAGFQTARLTLRPIVPTDAGPIFDGYVQDLDVIRFMTWKPHTHVEETRSHVARCLEATASRTYILVNRASGKLLGAFDLRQPGPHRCGYGHSAQVRGHWAY